MGTLARKSEDAFPGVVHEELCISCGHCVAICPSGAITHANVPAGHIHTIRTENLTTTEQLTQVLATRRSIRAFKQKPVESNLIGQILQAACLAPSAHNSQSTEYIVVRDAALLGQITQLTANYLEKLAGLLNHSALHPLLLRLARDLVEDPIRLLPELKHVVKTVASGRDIILHHAPALLVFHARRSTSFAAANACMAAQNASLVAQSLGLGTFHAGYMVITCEHDNKIPRLLGVPRENQIYAALAVGHPAVRFTHWIEREPPQVRWI
jgi:nitroreductase